VLYACTLCTEKKSTFVLLYFEHGKGHQRSVVTSEKIIVNMAHEVLSKKKRKKKMFSSMSSINQTDSLDAGKIDILCEAMRKEISTVAFFSWRQIYRIGEK
jgi:hypothetical protein